MINSVKKLLMNTLEDYKKQKDISYKWWGCKAELLQTTRKRIDRKDMYDYFYQYFI